VRVISPFAIRRRIAFPKPVASLLHVRDIRDNSKNDQLTPRGPAGPDPEAAGAIHELQPLPQALPDGSNGKTKPDSEAVDVPGY
jgi:hypothetical protein